MDLAEQDMPFAARSLATALAVTGVLAVFAFGVALGGEVDSLRVLEGLLATDPKPFVLVEARGTGFVGKGQGVVITPRGHVLTAGHVSWDDTNQCFVDGFRVSFRTWEGKLPAGAEHTHNAVYVDREQVTFHEHWYAAALLRQDGSRFVANGDLSLLRITADGPFPALPFFSQDAPTIRSGETLHLCHYNWPRKDADPTFLMNPVEVVGVVQTTSGLQYLATGYYRWGSSGGAILKEGRLIGLQSAAYTVNAKDIGEMPLGLLSFQPVWGNMVAGLLESVPAAPDAPAAGAGEPEPPVRPGPDSAPAEP